MLAFIKLMAFNADQEILVSAFLAYDLANRGTGA